MASDILNRKIIRQALASLLDASLPSEWDVWRYGTSEFGGKARNVVVASGDAEYPSSGAQDIGEFRSESGAEFFFNIGIFILYANAAQNWSAENSQDALDDGLKMVVDIVRDNYKSAAWDEMLLNGRSAVGIVADIGGVPYRSEIVPVRIRIF